jgi:hypothetical protein
MRLAPVVLPKYFARIVKQKSIINLICPWYILFGSSPIRAYSKSGPTHADTFALVGLISVAFSSGSSAHGSGVRTDGRHHPAASDRAQSHSCMRAQPASQGEHGLGRPRHDHGSHDFHERRLPRRRLSIDPTVGRLTIFSTQLHAQRLILLCYITVRLTEFHV